jgi:hypothetical protein
MPTQIPTQIATAPEQPRFPNGRRAREDKDPCRFESADDFGLRQTEMKAHHLRLLFQHQRDVLGADVTHFASRLGHSPKTLSVVLGP